jgi:hypothetical protein
LIWIQFREFRKRLVYIQGGLNRSIQHHLM